MNNNLDIISKSSWLPKNSPTYFFGPCSAESPEQLYETAKGIAKNFENVIFRAGVWKPRTRPNSFEGIGEESLSWLNDIKKEFGFKIAIEVANAEHVEKALKADIDVLWIGARTTVNPFYVQAIAESLRGVDTAVFVKNPLHPDISLWVGALERLNNVGIKKIGAIHRGFHLSDNGPFRNSPNWALAVQLKAAFPNLPLICDVSHISGTPDLIPLVSQRAIDLDMDGLMVETHYNPKVALSDAEQQLTPEKLADYIQNLTWKKSESSNLEFTNKLELLRVEIDKIDDELVDQLANRMNLAKKIGTYKKENDVTILQLDRWLQILKKSVNQGNSMGLSEEFITQLYNLIHDESIRIQTLIQKSENQIS